MSDELFYTSAIRGLRPGSSGFCTVAATAGLGPAWQQRLEAVSGYKALYPVNHPHAGANPVAFAHTVLTVAGQTRSVLTRAAFAGADHTGRSNKFVHHLLPTDRERGPGGPAFAMRQPGLMSQAFAGESRPLTAGRAVPIARPAPAPAVAWQQATGDAAWAAVLAAVAIGDPGAIVYVLYAPGTDVLALFDEALRLLPEPRRWAVTFNTYVTEPPAAPCAWRGIIAGTPAAAMAKGTVIDLTNLNPGEVPNGPLAESARTGRMAMTESATGRHDQIRPVRIPSNEQISDTSISAVAPASSAVTSKSSNRRHLIPSNVRLAETRSRAAKSKAVIIGSIAAAVLLCVTAVGVGFWITKATTVIAAQPTTAPSTTGSAAKKRAAAEQAAAAAMKALEAASEASKTAAAAQKAADKAATERAEADKRAAEAAEKKKAADEAAAKAKEAAEKAIKDAEDAKKIADDATKEAEKKKAEADKASAEADAAEEFERTRLIIALKKDNDIPVEWPVSEKQKLVITDAKGIGISQAFCARPWNNDRVPLGTFVNSILFKIDIKDDRFAGILDNAQLNFTISVNGDTIECNFPENYKKFSDEALKMGKIKIAEKSLNDTQVGLLRKTVESMVIKDCRIKVTVPGSGSYLVKIKPGIQQ